MVNDEETERASAAVDTYEKNLEELWDEYIAWCREQENGSHEC